MYKLVAVDPKGYAHVASMPMSWADACVLRKTMMELDRDRPCRRYSNIFIEPMDGE